MLLPCLLLILQSGCGSDEAVVRRYQEIAARPVAAPSAPHAHEKPQAPPMAASAPRKDLQWQVPEGWRESAGGGMRLATFNAGPGDGDVTCTIISLGGAAGGLKQNVTRWLGQVELQVGDGALDRYLANLPTVEAGNSTSGVVVDFEGLFEEADPEAASMIATIFEMDGQTVFIKMTGNRSRLAEEKNQLLALSRSIR